MEILEGAGAFQREQGFVQWPDNGFDGAPAYPEIKGAWWYDEPCAVVHRIAIGAAFDKWLG